jgi:hypothetical protein
MDKWTSTSLKNPNSLFRKKKIAIHTFNSIEYGIEMVSKQISKLILILRKLLKSKIIR